VRIGELSKRVTIQQRTTTLSASGAQSTTWADVQAVWAAIVPMSGRELLAAQSVRSEVTHQVTIRYRRGITTSMRLSYGSRFFNIHAIMDDLERHRQLTVMCSEGLSDG